MARAGPGRSTAIRGGTSRPAQLLVSSTYGQATAEAATMAEDREVLRLPFHVLFDTSKWSSLGLSGWEPKWEPTCTATEPCQAVWVDRRQAANRLVLRITRRLALGGPEQPDKPEFDMQDEVRPTGRWEPTRADTEPRRPTPGYRHRLPPCRKMIDIIFEKTGRDGGIRTRGLLLPNQLQPGA